MYRALVLALALILALAGCGAAGQTQTQGDLVVTLETNPTTPIADRPTTFSIAITRGGAPLDGAYVTLKRQMRGMQHGGEDGSLIAQSLGNGRYETISAFSMGSRWDVAVAIEVPNAQPHVVSFPIEVEQP